MRSNRLVITLGITTSENVKGVITKVEKQITLRATRKALYQKRVDQANLNDKQLTGRFEVRDVFVAKNVQYIIVHGLRYKISSIQCPPYVRKAIIEAGELLT